MNRFPEESTPAADAPIARDWGRNPRSLVSTRRSRSHPVPGRRASPSIELHIDRLVVDGIAAINRVELSLVLQAELSHLLAERGLPNASGGLSLAQMDGGAFKLPSNANTRAVATHVAQAIYGGLNR